MLIIENINPYTTVTEYVEFESYELTLDASLFAEIEFIVHDDQLPPEQCPLNICVSDAISIDEESGDILVDRITFDTNKVSKQTYRIILLSLLTE